MSTVKIPTRHLVGLLMDLIRSASKEKLFPHLCAVLLHSDHATVTLEPEDEEGEALIGEYPSDVLVGTSTDGKVVGQAHAPCNGTFPRVVLISSASAKAVVDVFGPLAKNGGTVVHHTEMVLSGSVLTVSEDPTTVPDGKVLSVPVLECVDDFPSNVAQVLEPDPGVPVLDDLKRVVEPTYGTGLNAEGMLVLGAVAKRRGMPLVWYRHHQGAVMVVTVGAWYRAAVSPVEVDDPGALGGPLVPVFAPVFPSRVGQSGLTVVS